MSSAPWILLIDGDAPWVRSLFEAVALTGTNVRALQVRSLGVGLKRLLDHRPGWRTVQPGYFERELVVPGWTRFHRPSTFIVSRAARLALKEFGVPAGIVYTLPHYAGVAEEMQRAKLPNYYYAHDPFLFYDWPIEWTRQLEKRMLNVSVHGFGVARLLCADLAAMSECPVTYSPNAVSGAFVETLQAPGPVPADLARLRRPIIGCVGQINQNYDWELLEGVSALLPECTLAFVGPVLPVSAVLGRRIEDFWKRPNVAWLGARPHADLPKYLAGFDLCLNPLAVTDHSNRRSPLRLYDYLATSKPIVSTPIEEARAHEGLVEIVDGALECATAIRRLLPGVPSAELERRRAYLAKNTWEVRAQRLLRIIRGSPVEAMS